MVMGGDVCADANSVSNAMTAAANSFRTFRVMFSLQIAYWSPCLARLSQSYAKCKLSTSRAAVEIRKAQKTLNEFFSLIGGGARQA
jgi:hypothetical protein